MEYSRKVALILILSLLILILQACAAPTSLPTPVPSATSTPATTPTFTITPTYPCPMPTQELPPMVRPLTSPTDENTQLVYVSGNFEAVTIRTESGEFSAEVGPDGGPLVVTVKLLPNTVHHLIVTARVRQVTWQNCTYGGYTMTTVTDSEGKPLTIMQGIPPTPFASTQPITPKNVESIRLMGSLDASPNISGLAFFGELELFTFGFNQPIARWQIPSLARLGTIGKDEALVPGAVSMDFYPVDNPSLLAVGGAGNPGGSEEFSVKYMGMEENKWSLLGDHNGTVKSVAFSPLGDYLASAANDDAVKIWRLKDSQLQSVFSSGRRDVLESFWCLSWLDEQTLWAGGDQALYRINAQDGSLLQTIRLDGNYACSFSRDGRWFAATDQSITVKLVDLQQGEVFLLEPYAPDQYPGVLMDAALSPDGQLLAVINDRGMWFVWNTADRQLRLLQPASLTDGYRIEFSPQGRYLAMNGWSSPVVQLWGIP